MTMTSTPAQHSTTFWFKKIDIKYRPFKEKNNATQPKPEGKYPYRQQPWLVCLSASLFFFYEFIQMGMFNSISQELMQAFSINASQLGFLSATYFYADVLFLLAAGMLVDRFSIRYIILSAMSIVILATILFACSHSLRLAAISHFITGIGNAFCFLSCIKLATRWFPSHRLALVVGIMVTIAMLGGVIAQTPFTLLVQTVGWRSAIFIDAMVGIGLLFIIYRYVYDHPTQPLLETDPEPSKVEPSTKLSLLSILKNRQNGLSGLYTCLLNLPVFLLGELWGVLYLTEIHHLTKTQASLVTTMVFIGTIIGSPLAGWFSDYIGRRKLPMILGSLFALINVLCIIFISSLNFFSLMVLFLLLGFFTSTQIITYPLIAESNPKQQTATATSLASILIMGGGAVFQPLFGWVMDLFAHTSSQASLYSTMSYTFGLSILPIAFIVSILAACMLCETRCQPYT